MSSSLISVPSLRLDQLEVSVRSERDPSMSKAESNDRKNRAKIREIARKLEEELARPDEKRYHNVKIPVCQVIVVKRIVPDSYDDLSKVFLEATIVQHVLGYGKMDIENGPVKEFEYRVNGTLPTGDECIERRRCVPIEAQAYFGKAETKKNVNGVDDEQEELHDEERDGPIGVCFTIDARVPLALEDELHLFPFRIMRATISLEMVSPSLPSGAVLRPDQWMIDVEAGGSPSDTLLLKTKRNKHKGGKNGKNNDAKKRSLMGNRKKVDKVALLDCLPQWDFVIETPVRECPPERKSDGTCYHPKTILTWYMTDVGLKRMLPSLAPLYLVFILAVVNWYVFLKDDPSDANNIAEHLGVSVGISLTAVVLLPNVMNTLDMRLSFNLNDVVFLCWLTGLGLSSIPDRMTALGGIFCLGVAGASPFLFLPYYVWKLRELRRIATDSDYTRPATGREKPKAGDLFLHHWTFPSVETR